MFIYETPTLKMCIMNNMCNIVHTITNKMSRFVTNSAISCTQEAAETIIREKTHTFGLYSHFLMEFMFPVDTVESLNRWKYCQHNWI